MAVHTVSHFFAFFPLFEEIPLAEEVTDTYTGDVNDGIHPLDCLIKDAHFFKVFDLDEFQLRRILRPGCFHRLALSQRPCRAAD